MKNKILFSLTILLSIFACKSDDETLPPSTSVTQYDGYTLIWNDEFNGLAISNLNWTYETGDGTAYGLPSGWGNDEKQIYTNAADNSFIEEDADGVSALVIVAQEESPGNYTSAKLTTQELQSFRFGRIEARIKLPTDRGMWPAFWMLGDNKSEVDWPGCGEIDIMELVGQEPNVIHGTAHYTDANKMLSSNGEPNMLATGNFDDAYHDFRLDWTPSSLIFSLDEVPYHTVTIEDDMKEFLRSFYLILNVAVGGNWPGDPDATTSFPQKMYVDYIRVYSIDGLNPPATPALNIDEETIGVIIPPSQAQLALNTSLNQFPNIELNTYGAGGEPVISSTDEAIEGDSALLFSYPGGTWGGGWLEMSTPLDMSAFTSGNLVFSIRQPSDLSDAEIKLEAFSNAAAVFLINYTPIGISNGYVEYTIPLSDFTDLDFSDLKVPFSLWNPVNDMNEYPVLDVYLDNIYWEE